jgi:hypothetical protein
MLTRRQNVRFDPKMVIVKIVGGLGNQMFQYAFGRTISLKYQTPLFLDLSAFTTYQLHSYSLNHFNIQARIASPQQIQKLTQKNKWWFGSKPKVFQEPHFYFCPAALSQKPSRYFDGYWQSENYFSGIIPTLRKDLSVAIAPDLVNLGYVEKMKSVNSVSLHIRRGDYVSNPSANQVHGVMGLEYYHQAIESIQRQLKDPYYFIFSDDPEWAKQNLKLDGPTDYIGHNGPEKNYEDLRLMSSCRAHIIANSTFSWWGAWLNPDPTKTVIAPKVWFASGQHNDKDLIPKNWIRI